jgi:hypothetical protein
VLVSDASESSIRSASIGGNRPELRDYQSRLPAARFLQALSPGPATSVSLLGVTDPRGRFSFRRVPPRHHQYLFARRLRA